MRLFLFALLAWLGAAGVARAQEVTAAPDSIVEVPTDGPTIVRIPATEEVVIVESDRMDVTQIGPDRLEVVASPSGRAVVLLKGSQGIASVVIRALAEAHAEEEPRVGAAPSPHAPDVTLGGTYQLAGSGTAVAGPSMMHFGEWSQLTRVAQFDAGLTVVTLPGGQTGIQHVGVYADAPGWTAGLGDVTAYLLPNIEGALGAALSLRGGSASVNIGETGFRVGAIGGPTRSLTCCRFATPEQGTAVALTTGFARRGFDVDALGGVLFIQGVATPLARVGVQYESKKIEARGVFAQSGPGTGGTVLFAATPTRKLSAFFAAGGSTAGFVRSHRGSAGEMAGVAGIRFSPQDRIRLEASARAVRRKFETSDSTLVGARLGAAWKPLRLLGIDASYQRNFYFGDRDGTGDTVGAAITFTPARWIFSGSGYFDLSSEDTRSLLATGMVGWSPVPGFGIDAGYRYMGSGTRTQKIDRDQIWLGTDYHTDPFTWSTDFDVLAMRGPDAPDPVLTSATWFAWKIRRFLEVGVGGSVSSPLTFDRIAWSASAFWIFHPTALPTKRGGLGVRGRVVGRVFLDENRNGLLDEGEEGLPDMTVTVDGSQSVVTDAEGRFEIRKLVGGAHEVVLDRQTMHSLASTRRTVEIDALGGAEDLLFPLVWGGRIQGLLYDDIHGDGSFDNGDVGVRCNMVSLRNSKGVVFDRVAADGGRFTFSGLAEGQYTVMVDAFELPDGYTPIDELEPTVFVEEGKALNVFIRVHANRAIGGIVWEDVDKDRAGGGKKDLGIGGAEVYLSTGEVATTGPDGSFLFRDLPPGAYAVRTELSTEAKVVVLPVEPKEVLDLAFILPKGTRPPEQNVTVAPKPPDSVAGLVLEAPMSVLPQGVELQVTATAVLSNGETREVTTRANWSSSDADILSVSPEGKVSGHTAGTAGVTAEWKGGLGDPLTFEVLGTPLDKITVSPVGLRLNPGNIADLRVDVVDRAGRGGEVTPVAVWQVADTKVARVDATGRLKALRDGVTTVQARIGETWSAPLEIQVITAEVTALSIENLPARMPEGATVQLKATGYDTRLEIQNVTETVTWSSSDPAVVQVEADGRIIAVGRGTAQITASIGSLFTRSRTVFVTNTPPQALEVVPPGMTISVYDVQRFRATATFEDGSKGAVTTVVEWIVEGTAALVRPDGTVVPREPGTVIVRARYLGVESAAVPVTVTP